MLGAPSLFSTPRLINWMDSTTEGKSIESMVDIVLWIENMVGVAYFWMESLLFSHSLDILIGQGTSGAKDLSVANY
jgi:hypothetical protein